MRDFNMTGFMDEDQGCEGNMNDMDSFNDLIRDLGIIDIPLGEGSFTWSNKQATPAFAKLDRCLIVKIWDDIFPLFTCKALSNTLSDHIPISLCTSFTHRCGIRFHFKSIWLEHRDLWDIVASAWSFVSHVDIATCLPQKLRKTRKALMV